MSVTVTTGESSMKIGALYMREAASTTRCQSGPSWPERSFMESTRPTEDRMRWTISSFDISRLNTATGLPWAATLVAMLMVRALFPIAGRAATITRLAF